LRAVLQGHITMDDAIAAIQQSTRRYAKRQLTWFRREPAVHWLEGFGDDALLQSQALNWLREQGVIQGRGAETTGV
jgi:tRNA dimethylallyltransferase